MGPMDAAVGIPLASLHCQTKAPVHHTMFCLLPSYCCSLDQPTRDGQAELTWVASYTPRFTRASTNSGKCRATCYQAIYKYGRVQRLTPQIIGHFGDDLPSKSFDWCKKLVFLTDHLAANTKTKYNYNQVPT